MYAMRTWYICLVDHHVRELSSWQLLVFSRGHRVPGMPIRLWVFRWSQRLRQLQLKRNVQNRLHPAPMRRLRQCVHAVSDRQVQQRQLAFVRVVRSGKVLCRFAGDLVRHVRALRERLHYLAHGHWPVRVRQLCASISTDADQR